jgi:hypothetical protein
VDPAAVRSYRPPAEGQAEADARALGGTPLERAKEMPGARPRQAAARILDFAEDAIRP